jgi:hypothetical protein
MVLPKSFLIKFTYQKITKSDVMFKKQVIKQIEAVLSLKCVQRVINL